MSIQYVEGDLFEGIKELKENFVLAHVVNCHGVFGAGFVIPLQQHFPTTRETYLAWHKAHKGGDSSLLGQTLTQQIDINFVVAHMCAQTLGSERPLYYNKLACCMDFIASHLKPELVVTPLFGAGLAGGDWNFIEQLIFDCWIRNGIQVRIYYLKQFLPSNWTPPAIQ